MMEEMLYKFIDKGKHEQEEMRAFIHEFRTTNELLFKERNNSLSELRFEVEGLLRVINNTLISNLVIKGVTTRGGKTTTQDVEDNDTNIHTREPLVINHEELVEPNEVLTEDQPQKTDEPVVRPTRTRLTKITEGTMVNSTEYRSITGCLRYLLHARPDLSYSVGLLSRFMQEPREQHMKAIRQVLRYVKGKKDYGITYKHNEGNKIHGFSNSSYGVNTQEGKGTTGIIFYYGESPISWSTQKQATVAIS
nr:ribonuclease H-like domain, reverse transcriptase, RNA-dependent DNA polymerase [Tanacetum cinerariifolium]